MAYQFATYEKQGRIAYVTIKRPEVMNALHPPASKELYDIWMDFKQDPDLWIAILTGAGDRAFCTGNDMKYRSASMGGRSGSGLVWHSPAGIGGLVTATDMWKPIIAAVHGYVLGGGLDIALSCDVIVAADNAQLALLEARVGGVSRTGVHHLARKVPMNVAMGMIMTGKPIGAQEAYRIGLVNEVVPRADLMPAAERWAENILECAPLSVRASKQAVLMGLDKGLESALTSTYPLLEAAIASEDNLEGAKAFKEKRKPAWKAR